jgi:hypothetical protein
MHIWWLFASDLQNTEAQKKKTVNVRDYEEIQIKNNSRYDGVPEKCLKFKK